MAADLSLCAFFVLLSPFRAESFVDIYEQPIEPTGVGLKEAFGRVSEAMARLV